MSIEKQTVVDVVEVLENGVVQVRTATRIVEDGKIISQSFHRHLVEPGQDYSNEDQRVQSVCAAVHTPEAVEAYKASMPKGV
jgi:hypothetical protein